MLGATEALAQVFVAAGAAVLDEERPGWLDEVTRPVNIASGQVCVLAQVFGDYVLGLMYLKGANGSWAARHGFYSRSGLVERWPTYAELNVAWADLIEARRREQISRAARRNALRAAEAVAVMEGLVSA